MPGMATFHSPAFTPPYSLRHRYGVFGNIDLPAGFYRGRATTDQYISLPELHDDLLSYKSLTYDPILLAKARSGLTSESDYFLKGRPAIANAVCDEHSG